MRVSLEQFVRRLIRSGLMVERELSDYQDSFPPEKRPKDAETLARELIRDERLTAYQAKAVFEGTETNLVLGEYVLLQRIGRGGMGEVFKAIHRHLDRYAAIKVLRPETLESPGAVRRFRQEVKVAARLNHPNIVATYDAGEEGGVHYLVMEYVEGCDLAALVKKDGPLGVPQAIGCVIQAARGLQYAHRNNVLHRDIKPANLLLDREGTIRILDLGLARMIQADDAFAGATLAERLTRTGQMLGTVDYVSPEQAADTRSADHRSDIYSLGCTLYSLVTGRPVYEGDSPMSKLIAHRDAEIPSLRERLPEALERLNQVFARMLSKRPEDRYQSMTEVVAALEACLESAPPAAGQARSPSRDRDLSPPSPDKVKVSWREDQALTTPAAESHRRFACRRTVKPGSTKTVEMEASSAATQREQPTVDDRPTIVEGQPIPAAGSPAAAAGRSRWVWLLIGIAAAGLLLALSLLHFLAI